MRAYFFTNMYLQGIQNGIQPGHAGFRMWRKCVLAARAGDEGGLDILMDFTENHETWVVLCAGGVIALESLVTLFESSENPHPWHSFYEPGLGGALTALCIVIPERLYDDRSTKYTSVLLADGGDWTTDQQYTAWEREFLKRRVVCPLAR